MQKTLRRFGLQALSVFLVIGCLSQIEIDTVRRGGMLVVSGQVSNLADRNKIEIGRTAEEERLPFPLSGAFVQLHDDQGNTMIYEEDPVKPGTYRLENFSGVPGHTYFVEIALPEGQVYYSEPEKMAESSGSHELYYEVRDEEFVDLEGTISQLPFIHLYVNADLASTSDPSYVKWSAEEVYLIVPTDFPDPFGHVPPDCFVTQNADPQRLTLFDGSEYKADQIDDQLVASRLIDRSFHYRHYFTTYQIALTSQAYEYWRKVDIVANQVGSIFDTPPAAITGNVAQENGSDIALGYFQAVNENYQRFFILPTDLPFTLNYQNCTFDPLRRYDDYPRECLSCLSARNSSLVRPPWF